MDITTYALLKKKIDQLGISDSKIEEVIEKFLLAHPEYIGATDQQAAQIIANAAAIQGLEADEIKIVTLSEYNALTEEQKKEKNYLIWDESTNNILIDNILDENSTNPVQNKVITKEITELKKSVSDGKTLVAAAITEKGVATEGTDSFATMAENISNIQVGGASKGILSAQSTPTTNINNNGFTTEVTNNA